MSVGNYHIYNMSICRIDNSVIVRSVCKNSDLVIKDALTKNQVTAITVNAMSFIDIDGMEWAETHYWELISCRLCNLFCLFYE